MQELVVHLVSEVSGQTVKHAANTALSKFSGLDVKKYYWPMIKNKTMLLEIVNKIKAKPGVVLFTISNPNLRRLLKESCRELNLPCVSVVSKVINEISEYLGINADDTAGKKNKFDANYFNKVDAIDYALKYDDGQTLEGLNEADIILIGPSRTSKTPISIYLAYNGFKTANIPYVHNCLFPSEIYELKKPLVFGLLINPSRLIEIRENRMNLLQMKDHSNYTDIKIVQEECRNVRKICSENKWHTIDVSMRSIEETAAIIMRHYYAYKMK
ncbi:MAG: hypothetical protein DGJ47_000105 [Rickettsiaceae bacterium]